MSEPFWIVTVTPAGITDPAIALAGSRAGGLGMVDCEFCSTAPASLEERALQCAAALHQVPYGVKLSCSQAQDLAALGTRHPIPLSLILLTQPDKASLAGAVTALRPLSAPIFLECLSEQDAHLGQEAGVDGLVAKGNESGGRVSEESTFILLQRLIRRFSLPILAQGGIGPHTAAACRIAGARGVILDSQLALTRESSYPQWMRERIAAMDGTETLCCGTEWGQSWRLSSRFGAESSQALKTFLQNGIAGGAAPAAGTRELHAFIASRVDAPAFRDRLYLFGQDIGLAASLAGDFVSVGGIVQAVRRQAEQSPALAALLPLLAAGAPLAASHGTALPLVQGPMARVSDTPAFARAVADHGALPFVAAAMTGGEELVRLLEDTRQRLAGKPWGVGLLGFLPADRFAEQLKAVLAASPRFALLAGGKPEQVKTLEEHGIATYVHVPSPALLRLFLTSGVKRFVFEGREAGGHVAPLCSFALWETMTSILLDFLKKTNNPERLHILFAGGIHDALSAAMVASLAAPLAAAKACVGLQLGSAYLFTDEAVASGAITERYRREALSCTHTALLESGVGHASRCAITPFVTQFGEVKARLLREQAPASAMREKLEHLNLGRLRVAAKGLAREQDADGTPGVCRQLDDAEQVREGLYMVGQLAALQDAPLSMAELHRRITEDGARRLGVTAREWPATAGAPGGPPEEPPSDIAIIGLSCLLPGASTPAAYWENILNGVNVIREVPPERWDWRLYFDPEKPARDRCYSRWGSFLDEIPFDPMRHGIPPAALPSIEPLQLLALEAANRAMDDAGYGARPFPREKTSVILGISGVGELGQLYSFRATLPMLLGRDADALIDRAAGFLPEWTEDSFPGILMNVAAGRIANRLNLGGTNFTVDAACASSLAAVYLGVRELEQRASDMVIVGAADCMQNPFTFLCFAQTQALSPRGRCHAFDANADGIALGEGVVALILKRKEDAERDGDRIYAVIKAVGAAGDGKGTSLTAPRVEGQTTAFRRAYAKAGFSPATVGLVEAHGTGTVLGDRVEIESLAQVWTEAGARPRGCAVGSVKSLIGHTKSTAGMAGLVKAALALAHRTLPPTAGIEQPNAALKDPASPLYPNTATRPWVQDPGAHPRRAGVSALGFGGTNFHVVLEEHASAKAGGGEASFRNLPAELFLFTGADRGELLSALAPLENALRRESSLPLRDLSYTILRDQGFLFSRRPKRGMRLALVAASSADLLARLAEARSLLSGATDGQQDPRGLYFSAAPMAGEGRKTAFLFPGQGSQYENMGADLAVQYPAFAAAFDRSDHLLAGLLDRPLSSFVFPPSPFDDEEKKALAKQLARTNIAQPALGTVNLALFHLLADFDLHPDMTAGHSYGEYVALAVAGVLAEKELILLSEARGRYIVEAARPEPGTMAALKAPADLVAGLIAGKEGLWIANRNAPDQTIISGGTTAVQEALTELEAKGVRGRRIPVACAFHSPVVAGAAPRLLEHLAGIALGSPVLPVYSNTLAAPYPSAPEAIRNLLAEHLQREVRFADEIEAMYRDGARIFVEVGPNRVLTGLVAAILGDRPHVAVSTNQPGRPGLTGLAHALAQLAAAGLDPALDPLFEGRPVRALPLGDIEGFLERERPRPGTWLLNSFRVRPAQAPEPAPFTPLAGLATGQPTAAEGQEPAPVRRAPEPAPSPVPTGLLMTGGGDLHATMVQYQQLMDRFLETQRDIMMAFLQGGEGTLPASPPFRAETPAAGTGTTSPTGPPAQDVPADSRPVAPAGPPDAGQMQPARDSGANGGLDVSECLLQVVAERTGYPPEMLGLDLDMEADLGIDSIKRVEILSQALERVHAGKTQPERPSAGTFSGLRTLRGIAVRLREGAPGAPSAVVVPPPAETRSVPAGPDIANSLLQVAAERTGYPPEMLNLDLDLEADLGIDSIKRVEILAAVKSRLGITGETPRLAGSGARTLRAIIERLEAVRYPTPGEEPAAGAAAAPSTPAGDGSGYQDNLPRFVPVTRPLPAPEATAALAAGRAVLVTDDGEGIAARLADLLGSRGVQTVMLRLGAAPAGQAGSPLSPEALGETVARLRATHGAFAGLIHLAPLTPPPAAFADLDADAWQDRLALETRALFLLLKAMRDDLLAAGRAGGACVLAATRMGGGFGLDAGADALLPSQGGVHGLLKTVAVEWPEVRVKGVDLDPAASPADAAAQIAAELRAADGEVEVGYARGRRLGITLAAAPCSGRTATAPPLDRESVVLVTGGARGITALVAEELARAYQPTLVLVGRSPLPTDAETAETAGLTEPRAIKAALLETARREGRSVSVQEMETQCRRLLREREMRDNIAAMRAAGARVAYLAADVRDGAAFGSLLDGLYREHGRIDGVIHGSGIIEDKLLADMAPASFDRVLGTKAQSVFLLARHLRPESLRFLVLFSSVAGRFGNIGQAAYTAANEVVNKTALVLNRRWPGRVCALNWGPWRHAGMVSDELERQFARRGVRLIAAAAGARFARDEIALGEKSEAEVVIGDGPWGSIQSEEARGAS